MFFVVLHAQTDGQTKVVNRTFTTLLHAMIQKILRQWEKCLPHIEFTYNKSVHSTTLFPPFEIVYGLNPLTPSDNLPLPTNEHSNIDNKRKTKFMKKLHVKVQAYKKRRNEIYAKNGNKRCVRLIFDPGDWIHMRKERFLVHRHSNLLPKGDGPFQILECINDNAYKLDHSSEYNVSAIFNITNLSSFDVGDDLRANPFQEEGNDANIKTTSEDSTFSREDTNSRRDSIRVPHGPITISHAKRFKEALNELIQEV